MSSASRSRLDRILKYIVVISAVKVKVINSLLWQEVRCSSDPQQTLPDGFVSDIGRFPWLGVIQHNFYVGNKVRFAVTNAILIHPSYALASADDMAKIPYEVLSNNTRLIVWNSKDIKYAIPVVDYILHPEYEDKLTLASIAFVQLRTSGETGNGGTPHPVLPVCLPVRGGGSFLDAIYTVRMTDARRVLEKEAYKMNYVDEKDCLDFYRTNKLLFKSTTPVSPTCAVSERRTAPCVWDAGAALITRQSWGYWKLLGFSVRGPGCGAPARFLNIFDYLPWINDLATPIPEESAQLYRIGVRRISPVAFTMYNAKTTLPTTTGLCDRKKRGNVLYKDSFELLVTKNFIQGFFFLVISQIAEFTCADVFMPEVTAKTNTAMWIEHYCHREISGIAPGQSRYKHFDLRKNQCFLYFKSAAFVEFRFIFSFKTNIETVVYGKEEIPRLIPNPFSTDWTTDRWWPTDGGIRFGDFWLSTWGRFSG